MIRKNSNSETYAAGITLNLLLKSDGKKFGKSEKGAIFLNEKLTSPYEMYQFLINQNDTDVIKLLNFLTLIPTDEIKEIKEKSLANPKERIAQKILAEDIVVNVHGKEKYNQSLKISDVLFSGNIIDLTADEIKMIFNTIPSIELINKDFNLKEVLTLLEFSTSNKTARELINNSSIEVNGHKINDENMIINNQHTILTNYTIFKKGKKNYKLIK
jgi:tyrosyl-tRNA synthetase